MAEATVKSLLMQKLGADFVKAHEENKNVKPKPSGDLPGGIRNGIAKLVQCKIIEIGKGEHIGKLMFYASASVQVPREHDGIPIYGLFTQISEPIFPTPTRKRKTVSEHIKWIYEHLAGLGLPIASLRPDTIENAMDALRKSQPSLRFRTWLPPKATVGPYAGKEPMLMHFWDGKCDPPKSAQDDKKNAVNDTSPQVPEPPVPDTLPDDHPDAPENVPTPDASTGDINPEMIDQMDIDSLAKRGDEQQDLQAGQALIEHAQKSGIDQKLIDKANTWKELAELIKGQSKPTTANGVASNVEAPASNEIHLGIGDHWFYRPLNAKTKQKEDKPITVELTDIDGDKGVVTFKNVAMPRMVYRNISVDELEPIS